MGKSAPAMPPPPPPPPPPAPVQPVRPPSTGNGQSGQPTPQKNIMPAAVIDAGKAGYQAQVALAGRRGRKATRMTGPRGLLDEPETFKKTLG